MSRADGNFDPIEAVRAFLEEARCDSQIKRTEATIFTVSDASAAVGGARGRDTQEHTAARQPRKILRARAHVRRQQGRHKEGQKGARPHRTYPSRARRSARMVRLPPRRRAARRLPGAAADAARRGTSSTTATVWAAAGTDHAFFPVAPDELLRITGGEKSDVKKA